jgi:hypothetical protein
MRRAECPPTTNKCLRPIQTSLSVRRAYPLAECGYPHIRLVWSRTSQSWLPQTTGRPPGRSQRTELQVWLGYGALRGRAEQSVEEHTPCFHCLDTGWFMLTAENDFGELEDYFVLSGASAKRRSVKFLGAAHVLVGEA